MRNGFIALLVVSFSLSVGVGVLLSDIQPGPDGLPDISGTWVGKVKIKGFDMTGYGDHEKVTMAVTFEIDQEGEEIDALVTPDDGTDPFEMEGLIGDGHLWLASLGDGGIALMIGHVKNKGKKIKAVFLSGEDDYVFEMKVNLKRPK